MNSLTIRVLLVCAMVIFAVHQTNAFKVLVDDPSPPFNSPSRIHSHTRIVDKKSINDAVPLQKRQDITCGNGDLKGDALHVECVGEGGSAAPAPAPAGGGTHVSVDDE